MSRSGQEERKKRKRSGGWAAWKSASGRPSSHGAHVVVLLAALVATALALLRTYTAPASKPKWYDAPNINVVDDRFYMGAHVREIAVGDEQTPVLVIDDVLPIDLLDALYERGREAFENNMEEGHVNIMSDEPGRIFQEVENRTVGHPESGYRYGQDGRLEWDGVGEGFAGVRVWLDNERLGYNIMEYISSMIAVLNPLFERAYGQPVKTYSRSGFGVYCAQANSVHSARLCPHTDYNSGGNLKAYTPDLASSHYLFHPPGVDADGDSGLYGTSFYRWRKTGQERMNDRWREWGLSATRKRFEAQLDEEGTCYVGNDALREAWLDGSTDAFEEIARIPARRGRVIIYPGLLLHSASYDGGIEGLTCRPELHGTPSSAAPRSWWLGALRSWWPGAPRPQLTWRLTINTFWSFDEVNKHEPEPSGGGSPGRGGRERIVLGERARVSVVSSREPHPYARASR